MKYTPLDETRFRSAVSRSLDHIRKVLETTRHPQLAEHEAHTYDDKFALAEFLTNTAVAAVMNVLERLGLTADQLKTAAQWTHTDKQTVTLRFQAHDSCTLLKEAEVEIAQPHRYETTTEETTTTSTGTKPSKTNTTTQSKTMKLISRVKQYHWKIDFSYTLQLFPGTDMEKALELQTRKASTILITSEGQVSNASSSSSSSSSPFPPQRVHPAYDLRLGWFLTQIDPNTLTSQFGIHRNHNDDNDNASRCKTPRRNDDIDEAVRFYKALRGWSHAVPDFVMKRVERILSHHNPASSSSAEGSGATVQRADGSETWPPGSIATVAFNGEKVRILEYLMHQDLYRVEPVYASTTPGQQQPLSATIEPRSLTLDSIAVPGVPVKGLRNVNDETVLCPIVPLMEKESVLSLGDVGSFLEEQNRSLDSVIDETLVKVFPPKEQGKIVSIAEAKLVLFCKHLQRLAIQYMDSVDYIEDMLKKQLVAAIGKHVKAQDFEDFMRYHSRKFFAKPYAPIPFSHVVRRPEQFPDGVVTIEACSGTKTPIETWVRRIPGAATAGAATTAAAAPIYVPINATTSIELCGDVFLHGWMQHRFSGEACNNGNGYQLNARAHQFSSFMLLVGSMAGPDQFDPKRAMILQNKDEVLIPLLTNTLPTAKEFKDAIASLSPEQQAFAKAFREMQLSSSVFAVCVIQLKPQQEKVLGLPDGSLTKEIQLTQDLMSLFIEYQIPSNILSLENHDQTEEHTTIQKVDAVRGYVKTVMEVIDNAKKAQLQEAEQKRDMAEEQHAAQVYQRRAWRRSCRKSEPMEPPTAAAAAAAAAAGASAPVVTTTMSHHGDATSSNAAPANSMAIDSTEEAVVEDFTLIPKVLDQTFEKYDTENALHATVIKTREDGWTLQRQANLLTLPSMKTMSTADIDAEKKKAFDLLDAITKSGALPISCAELHVVVAVSHCFDNDLMGTVIEDNINPIEKVERSSLLLASTIHQVATAVTRPSPLNPQLIKDKNDWKRLQASFPDLFSDRGHNSKNSSSMTDDASV